MQVARRTLFRFVGAAGAGMALSSIATWEAGAMTLPTPPPGMVRRTLASGRTYLIYQRTGTSPGPVIFGLHMTAHDAIHCNDTMWVSSNPALTGWSRHASSRDYTLVLGEGLQGKWNVGNGWPGGTQDDDGYLIQALIDVLGSQSNADPDQVYVAGSSAGAAMAWRMAALYPQYFKACASASGWAPVYPSAPIDCYHIHGTADTTVPIGGGSGVYSYVFPPIEDETRLVPRGSRVIIRPTSGGHGVPGWMAQRALDFFLIDRARP